MFPSSLPAALQALPPKHPLTTLSILALRQASLPTQLLPSLQTVPVKPSQESVPITAWTQQLPPQDSWQLFLEFVASNPFTQVTMSVHSSWSCSALLVTTRAVGSCSFWRRKTPMSARGRAVDAMAVPTASKSWTSPEDIGETTPSVSPTPCVETFSDAPRDWACAFLIFNA